MSGVQLQLRPNFEINVDRELILIKQDCEVITQMDRLFFEDMVYKSLSSYLDFYNNELFKERFFTSDLYQADLNIKRSKDFLKRLESLKELKGINLKREADEMDVGVKRKSSQLKSESGASGRPIKNAITIEGGEGSGKSTIVKKLMEFFQERLDLSVYYLREPGGVKVSEKIRKVILDPKNEMDAFTEALLFAAARNEMYNQKMFNILEDTDNYVIMDRSVISSIVMQGMITEIGPQFIKEINNSYIPELIIVLDVDPDEGMRRINERAKENDRIDQKGVPYATNVNNAYKVLADKPYDFVPNSVKVAKVDANRPIEEVYEEVRQIVYTFINNKSNNLKNIKRVDKKWL